MLIRRDDADGEFMRKTKIICTMGPSTDDDDILRSMMKDGMNVARFNFSHGTYEEHKKRFDQVVRIRTERGLPVATLLDTKGPEIRLGVFPDGPVELADGESFTLTTEDIPCDGKRASISFKGLPEDVKKGITILINDGAVELTVTGVSGREIYTKVVHGGVISDRKGINVPGVELSMPYLSEKDMNDLEFGAKIGYDFIAASFVRTAADVAYLRKFIKSLGWSTPRIIAKIENWDGVRNIDEILTEADGIMVARGDMGVEIPFEQIPAIQKNIIRKGYHADKQVITATQMLESMITNIRPTRAEITDVANAIYDGTSAIMLSGETAAGKHPVEAVRTMALIAETTEDDINYTARFKNRLDDGDKHITNAISHAACTTAYDIGARAILTVTKTGGTAKMISKFRPKCSIIGLTPDPTVCRQMNLSWGVTPLLMDEKDNTDELLASAVEAAVNAGLIVNGDHIVITAGIPLGVGGSTNMIKVITVGKEIQ